ncbi:dynamin family protein [Frankia sp. CiP3]|uniref:dynamin family protein n=1 Tax=Frankia sp. CiP3 TaxID=2880971 RepID=UPI001EF5DDA2|nr:dynamin family protein [Frankia sp. CiP3]
MTASLEIPTPATGPGIPEPAAELAKLASVVLSREAADTVVAEIGRVTRRSGHAATVAEFIGLPGTGKSKLCNLLIGRDLLPTGLGETTARPVTIVHDQSERAHVIATDDTILPIGLDEVAAYVSYAEGVPVQGVASVEIGLPSTVLADGLVLKDTSGEDGLLSPVDDLPAQDADIVVLVTRADSELHESELRAFDAAVQTVSQVCCVITHVDVCADWQEILRRNRELLDDRRPGVNIHWFVNRPGNGEGYGGLDELRDLLGSTLPGSATRWRPADALKALGGIAARVEEAGTARLAALDPTIPAAARLAVIDADTRTIAQLRQRLETAHRAERKLMRERMIHRLQLSIRRTRQIVEAELSQPRLPSLDAVVDQINTQVIDLWTSLAVAAPQEAAVMATVVGRAAGADMTTWTAADFADLQPTEIIPVESHRYDSLLGDVLEFAPIGTAGWIYRRVAVATGLPGLGLLLALGATGTILHRRHYRMQATVLRRDVSHYLYLRLDETQSMAIRAIDSYLDAAETKILEIIRASLAEKEAEFAHRKEAVVQRLRSDEALVAPARGVMDKKLKALRALRERLR